MGFSRQEYWSGLPFPSPGDLPNSGIKPESPVLRADSSPSEPPEAPLSKETPRITHTPRSPIFGVAFFSVSLIRWTWRRLLSDHFWKKEASHLLDVISAMIHVPHRSVYATYAWAGCCLPAMIRNPSSSPLVSPAQRRDKQDKWVDTNLASPGLGWSRLVDQTIRYSESRVVQLIWPFSWYRRPLSERNDRILSGPQRYHRQAPHALAPFLSFFYPACTAQHMGSQFPNQGWDGTQGPWVRSLASSPLGHQGSPALASIGPVYSRDTSVGSQFSWLLSTTQN